MPAPPPRQPPPRALLFLDSGLGGLSLLQALRARGAHTRVDYLADNAWQPYGEREPRALIARVTTLLDRHLKADRHAAVVLACNTASCVALPALRARLPVPVVGVVPAIKPAAAHCPGGQLLLLATPATATSPCVDALVERFVGAATLRRHGAGALVDLAERRLRGDAVAAEVARALSPCSGRSFDAVVLGCTHFPWLRAEIGAVFPGAALIDSGAAVARQIERCVGRSPGSLRRGHFISTAATATSAALAPLLDQLGLDTCAVSAAA